MGWKEAIVFLWLLVKPGRFILLNTVALDYSN